MKKKRGGRKKVKASSHKKFRFKSLFNEKFFLILLIVNLFVLAFLLSFVNKGGSIAVTGHAVNGTIAEFFSADWLSGNLDAGVAKYLFWFMVTILVWSILSFAKFPPNVIFQALIALPVGFLATAYLTPEEVFSVLQSYEALGIVLTFIVPFILVLFLSAMLVSAERIKYVSVPKIMMEVFLWIFFVVVLGYKIISGLIQHKIPLEFNITLLVMGVIFLASFLFTIFNKVFRTWIWNIGIEIRRAQIAATGAEASAALKWQKAVEKETK